MEPRLFTLRDPTYRPFVDGRLLRKRRPRQYGKQVSLAIPEAYLTRIYTEPDGWGSRTVGIAIEASSQNLKPFRTEQLHIRKTVAEELNINLISQNEKRLRRERNRDRRDELEKRLSKHGIQNWRFFLPDWYSRRRYDDELLRRGLTIIKAGIGASPVLMRKEQQRRLILGVFKSLEAYTNMEGCTRSPGPWPNSWRYEPLRQVLAERGPFQLNGKACFGHAAPKNSYGFVKRDQHGRIEFTAICSNYNEFGRFGFCQSRFYWKGIWSMGMSVDTPFEDQIPTLIARTRELFDGFEDTAKAIQGDM